MTPTQRFVMDKMVNLYRIVFFKQQTIKLFAERKTRAGRATTIFCTWLPFRRQQTQGDLILENNVKYAQLDPQDLLISQYYRFRKDYLANAKEIVSYIQGLEDERVGKTKTGCG